MLAAASSSRSVHLNSRATARTYSRTVRTVARRRRRTGGGAIGAWSSRGASSAGEAFGGVLGGAVASCTGADYTGDRPLDHATDCCTVVRVAGRLLPARARGRAPRRTLIFLALRASRSAPHASRAVRS